MTLTCLHCGSHDIDDSDAPWDAGKIPCCPFCRDPLRDQLGALLGREADRGWCYAVVRHERKRPVDYPTDRWDWRDRDAFDYRDFLPLNEASELAAAVDAEVPDHPTMEDDAK